MKRAFRMVAALSAAISAPLSASLVAAGATYAGGIKRGSQSAAILFEEGRYAELTFGSVNPDISGAAALTAVIRLQPDTPLQGRPPGWSCMR